MIRRSMQMLMLVVMPACQTRQEFNDQDGDGVINEDDCAPTDEDIFPGATEVYDGRDNDCEGGPDEDFDQDEDGHFVSPLGDDCDDHNRLVHGGQEEVCGDGVDNDCDGEAGLAFPEAIGLEELIAGEGGDDTADMADTADAAGTELCSPARCVSGERNADLGAAISLGQLSVESTTLAALFVGEPRYRDEDGQESGRVRAWVVDTDVSDLRAQLTVTGTPGSRFGSTLSAGGDVDADGVADLLVGAEGEDAVWLYLSAALADDVSEQGVRFSADEGRTLGGAVLLLPDPSGDGMADLVLGAKDEEEMASGVWLLSGSGETYEDLTGEELSLEDDGTGAWLGGDGELGHAIAPLIGTGGLGWSGLALGAPSAAGCPEADGSAALEEEDSADAKGPAGVVWLLERDALNAALWEGNEASIDMLESLCIEGIAEADTSERVQAQFGAALASGDLDGDGYPDLLVGAPGADRVGEADVGVALVFLGVAELAAQKPLTMESASARLEGSYSGHGVGNWLDIPGDIDGDGLEDLLIGSFSEEDELPDTAADQGSAWMIPGVLVQEDGAKVDLGGSREILRLHGDGGDSWVVGPGGPLNGDAEVEILLGLPDRGEGGMFCVLWGQGP